MERSELMRNRSNRRWTLALTMFSALVLLLAACGDSKDAKKSTAPSKAPTFAAGSTMAKIQKKGKVVVGIKFDQPLFGLRSATSGNFEGFDVEVAKLIAQGIFGKDGADKISFKETPSKIREDSITGGDVDIVIATYTINDERKKVVDFAGPYFQAGQRIMVKSDNSDVKGVKDLNGKKVCSVTGSTSIDNIKAEAPKADISNPFDTYSKCAEELKNARVDAVTTDDSILYGLVSQNKGELKVVGDSFTEEPYGIGLKKGDDAFRTFLNDRIGAIEKSGEWKKAYEDTVGKIRKTTPEPPKVDRY